MRTVWLRCRARWLICPGLVSPFEVKGASYPYFGMVNVRNYADTVVYGYTTPTSNTYMPPEPLVVEAVHRMADEMHNGRGPKTR